MPTTLTRSRPGSTQCHSEGVPDLQAPPPQGQAGHGPRIAPDPQPSARSWRGQSYAILEQAPERPVRGTRSTMEAELSSVARRSLDIIVANVKHLFGDGDWMVVLVGYAKEDAQALRPRLDAMAAYMEKKGLDRTRIRQDRRLWDPTSHDAGMWDKRVEIEVLDIAAQGN